MKCASHIDQSALDVCKKCGRGICEICIAQPGLCFACQKTPPERIKQKSATKENGMIFLWASSVLHVIFGVLGMFLNNAVKQYFILKHSSFSKTGAAIALFVVWGCVISFLVNMIVMIVIMRTGKKLPEIYFRICLAGIVILCFMLAAALYLVFF